MSGDVNGDGRVDRLDAIQELRNQGVEAPNRPWWSTLFGLGNIVTGFGEKDEYESQITSTLAMLQSKGVPQGGTSGDARSMIDGAAAADDGSDSSYPWLAAELQGFYDNNMFKTETVVGEDGVERTRYLIPDERVEGGYREVRYTPTDPVATVMSMSEEELVDMRRKAWFNNYYGDEPPASWAGPRNSDDIEAMAFLMTNADIAGLAWQDYAAKGAELGMRYGRPITEQEIAGMVGDTAAQLREFAISNGIDLGSDYIKQAQRSVADGRMTPDQVLGDLRRNVLEVLYPSFQKEIQAGLDVSAFAEPYRQEALAVFGEDLGLDDPLIQSALQGEERIPLWQFREQIRNDERWQYTDSAYDEVGAVMSSAMSQMGLG